MTTIINAFHPDYMKTHEPNFMKEFRTIEAKQTEKLAAHAKVKAKKKLKMSYKVPKRAVLPKSAALEALKKRILEVKPFHIFAKAGMPEPFGFDKGYKKHGTDT